MNENWLNELHSNTNKRSRISKLTVASKVWQKSLNDDKVSPSLTSICLQFRRTLRMACVAQALLITCKTKHVNLKKLITFNHKLTNTFQLQTQYTTC